jgi:hypothetical protein
MESCIFIEVGGLLLSEEVSENRGEDYHALSKLTCTLSPRPDFGEEYSISVQPLWCMIASGFFAHVLFHL